MRVDDDLTMLLLEGTTVNDRAGAANRHQTNPQNGLK